jgi:hypothetical protein
VRGRAVALLLALAPTPSLGDDADDLGAIRLATCAALWDGAAAAFGDDGEGALARRFEAQASHRIGEDAARAAVEERRPWMEDLLAAYVEHGDDQSRDLFQQLLAGCAELEADLPD